MKKYIERIGMAHLVFWTIVRLLLLEVVVTHIVNDAPVQSTIAAALNLAGTFVWDIFQLLPKKFVFRHLSPLLQSLADVMIFCACYGGQYKGLYSTAWFDSILHFIAGALIFLCGCELIKVALEVKSQTAPAWTLLLGAAGISLLCGIGWELFEFSVDCIFEGSNTQHWQYAENELWLLPLRDSARFALMDTMGDIVCNTLGLAAGLIIKLFMKLFAKKNKKKEKAYV